MRKSNKKYRKFKKDFDYKKHQHELYRRKVRLRKKYLRSISGAVINKLHEKEIELPVNFSLYKNTNEVVKKFNNVFEIAQKLKTGKFINTIIFKLSKVKDISIESIMYLLAIMKNMKLIKSKKIGFKGDYPEDIKANQKFIDSGFIKYVNSPNVMFKENSECISIETGSKVNSTTAAKVVNFILSKKDISKQQQLASYEMLVELMANTFDHAYHDDSNMSRSWYLYVSAQNGKIMITFLDTGLGIPTTIHKRFTEAITMGDHKLTESAFKGVFRTKTRLKHRGRGLPKIYKYIEDKIIHNFYVVAGKAFCDSNGSNKFKTVKSLYNKFEGTLYYWEII
jgi:anti-sigma regulatory factor (Ser/Thr protein kinase)